MIVRIRSLRADARRRYVAVARAQDLGAAEASASADTSADTPLTTRVRTLYEDTIVPVAEIARLAGVTERTIYKYAQRRGWRPRVRRLAKGAGGRFIPLADAGLPVAAGLKALDPDGALLAATRCAQAAIVSDNASAAALVVARRRAARKAVELSARSRERALAHLSRGLTQIAKIREELRGQTKAAPGLLALAVRLEHALLDHMARVWGRG